jgi:hypothetical protein
MTKVAIVSTDTPALSYPDYSPTRSLEQRLRLARILAPRAGIRVSQYPTRAKSSLTNPAGGCRSVFF